MDAPESQMEARETSPEVGRIKALLARQVSLGGFLAYNLPLHRGPQDSPTGRWPVVQLAAVALLSVCGVAFLANAVAAFATAGARPWDPAMGAVLLFGLAAWLVAGIAFNYVVFLASPIEHTVAASTASDEVAKVHVSGLAVGEWARWTMLREATADLQFPHVGEPSSGGPIVVCPARVPRIEINPAAIRQARSGTVYPWTGPRPAIRLDYGKRSLVVSFDDVRTRDSWQSIFERCVATNDEQSEESTGQLGQAADPSRGPRTSHSIGVYETWPALEIEKGSGPLRIGTEGVWPDSGEPVQWRAVTSLRVERYLSGKVLMDFLAATTGPTSLSPMSESRKELICMDRVGPAFDNRARLVRDRLQTYLPDHDVTEAMWPVVDLTPTRVESL
jgi:hypothetical protein